MVEGGHDEVDSSVFKLWPVYYRRKLDDYKCSGIHRGRDHWLNRLSEPPSLPLDHKRGHLPIHNYHSMSARIIDIAEQAKMQDDDLDGGI